MLRRMIKKKLPMATQTVPWLAGVTASIPPTVLGMMARGTQQPEYNHMIDEMSRSLPYLPVSEVMHFTKNAMVHSGAAPLASMVIMEPVLHVFAHYMPKGKGAQHLEEHAPYYAALITWVAGVILEEVQRVTKTGTPSLLDVACNTAGLLALAVVPRVMAAWPDIRDGKDVIALLQPVQEWVMQAKEKELDRALLESMTSKTLRPPFEIEMILAEANTVHNYRKRRSGKETSRGGSDSMVVECAMRPEADKVHIRR